MIKIKDVFKNRSGVTFVDMLITVLLFSFISTALYATLLVGDRSWLTNSVKIEVQQDLRRARSWIENDLRQTGPSAIVNVPADDSPYATISFKRSSGVSGGVISWEANAIVYSLVGTELRRTQNSVVQVLGNNISVFSLTRSASAPDIIKVSITSTKSNLKGDMISSTINFDIEMRN